MIVIKVGGNELDSQEFLAGLAQAVALLPERPVLVHGGGRGTSMLMERFGLEPRFVQGLRVTDEQTLQLAVMGLVGQASAQLVQALVKQGVAALGLSGLDAALVQAERMRIPGEALGAVGRPVAVAAERIQALLSLGFVPCIAPICISPDGELLNVNADAVAQQVAVALGAERLILLTNVSHVIIRGEPALSITTGEIEAEIASGEINGGMIPKTRSAVAAVQAGVRRAVITDLEGLLTSARGGAAGTAVVASTIG